MKSPSELKLQYDKPAEVMDAVRAVLPDLERQYRLKLADAVVSYIQAYGFEGTYDRVNGKTVTRIFEEAETASSPAVVEGGEVDGVRYTLYDAHDDELRQEDR